MNKLYLLLAIICSLLAPNLSHADEELLQPFVLASSEAGNLSEKTNAIENILKNNGFTIAGKYSPYKNANIIIFTNDEMKKNATQSANGGFGAALRVALTNVKGEIQVSYTNPVYLANGYRMKDDYHNIAAQLEKILGKKQQFGGKGATAEKMRKYHYMMGMEYFDEPNVLGEFASHEDAIKAVENGLASGTEGVSKVFRIDVPNSNQVLFGVAMKGKPGTKVTRESTPGLDDQFGTLMTGAPESDQYIMSVIDFGEIKSTAHLPYEILVNDKKVLALYARFRIALNFPTLKMMGTNSFMNIMECPKAIKETLEKTVNPQNK